MRPLGVMLERAEPRDAEVDDLQVAVGPHQQVARLDVPMGHTARVGALASPSQIWIIRSSFFDSAVLRRLQHHAVQRLAFEQFHDDEVPAVVLAHVEDRDDIGWSQLSG